MDKGDRQFFWQFMFVDLLLFVSSDLHLNDMFLNLSSLTRQNTGIPIGGSLSAQLASLVLIYWELRSPLPESLG